VKELLVNARIGWGQPPAGWGQPQLPGWAPLVDPGPRPLRTANSVRRWWWPTLAIGGFLAVVVQVLDYDPGLSGPGLLTLALAAAVVALLTIHRRNGPRPLARALSEYTVVALLAALLAAPGVGVDQRLARHPKASEAGQAKAEAAAGDDQPAVLRAGAKLVGAGIGAARAVARAVRWLVDLWRQADQQASKDEAMAAPPPSPSPSVHSTWRFRS
jgi:hypothetical protein